MRSPFRRSCPSATPARPRARAEIVLLIIALLGLATASHASVDPALCQDCHVGQTAPLAAGKHAAVTSCGTCHEGWDYHLWAPDTPALYPKVHFDMKVR